MIQLNKNYSLPDALADTVPVKVVSVGGAGLNALDRIVLDGLEKASVVAINTDVQSLTSSVAAHKVQLGRTMTRGLGAGGDPELGYDAAVESVDEIRQALADARMIFVCAGLGGGTGSGAAPYVAQLAREAGAIVIAFVTLPFTFEGKRRNAQAREALARLIGCPLGDLLRERPNGRHRRAACRNSSGLRHGRHHNQPECSIDCAADPTAGTHSRRLR